MKNRDKEILRLREEQQLTMREIGEKVGVSRTVVWAILNDNGLTGRLPKKRLPKNLEGYSEEELSAQYKIPLSVVQATKRERLERKMGVMLSNRRKRLSIYLFGLKPGDKFAEFLEGVIDNYFSNRNKEIMLDFYIRGATESLSLKINSDTERVYRSNCRKLLKEIVDDYYVVCNLITEGVLSGSTRI